MNDLVGVMLTAKKGENLIKKSIDSLKLQTHDNWVCAIVQEGGANYVNEIIKSIDGDNRFIFLPEIKEQGYGLCRNAGAELLGEVDYLSALDSCDFYLPEHLSLRVDLIKNDKSIDFTYGKMEIIGDNFIMDMYDRARKVSIINETSQGPTIFIKQSKFFKLGGYNNRYGADGDLLRKAEAAGLKIKKLNDNIFKTYVLNNMKEMLN